MITRHFCAFIFLAFSLCVLASHAQSPLDYPQWRGRNRDGAASGFVEPKSWPENLRRRWNVPVGEGYATPLVIGETVYAFTRRDGQETMTALDVKTGRERWRSGYPLEYRPEKATSAHGAGPKATPLYHRGALYTLGITGIVTAFDANSGKQLWQTPPPADPPFFTAASSLAGEGDLVFAHPGNYGPLTAFNASTGDVKWKATGDGMYASPIVIDVAGTRQVVSALQDSIIGVAAADGSELWRHPWKAGGGSTTPIQHGDSIIMSGHEMGVTALKLEQREGKWNVAPIWATKEVSMFLSNPVIVTGTLYGLSYRASGQYFGLDVPTGKILWLGPPRQAENTAVVKAGGLLFLLENDGELIVARASRAGFEPIKRYTVAETATWAQPAISGNRIFVKDINSVTLWTVD